MQKNTRTQLKYDKSKPISEIVDELYLDYTNELALEYEEQNLDTKYPDFKSLMREYEEGILLFEATKISVWDKANQDTLGLAQYFESNSSKYRWDEKVTVDRFNVLSTDKKLIANIVKFAGKNSSDAVLKKFNNKGTIVEYATAEYERKAKELMGVEVKQNVVSAVFYNEKNTHFAKVIKITPAKNKSLSEARGYVVADYQDFLERQWIDQLRIEFPVQINKEVFTQLKRS
ncbi:MAG: peptidyl-prolyl cis-trans isomerase [Saprospiraceae bacterium]|nr:peptidyl-prolyl cis-trans isomerase [Saprospiraceae bacterium]